MSNVDHENERVKDLASAIMITLHNEKASMQEGLCAMSICYALTIAKGDITKEQVMHGVETTIDLVLKSIKGVEDGV